MGLMLLGHPEQFAIEIGATEPRPEFRDFYVQFRFWVAKVPLGNWHERISLSASTQNASHFLDLEPHRRHAPFPPLPADTLFQQVYEAHFSLSCFIGKSGSPDLRSLHHLDLIGMGATRDQYALIQVSTTNGHERILAKDLLQNQFAPELFLPPGTTASTLASYITWANDRLQEVRQ